MRIHIVDVNVVESNADTVTVITYSDSGSCKKAFGVDAPIRLGNGVLLDRDLIGGEGIAHAKFAKELDVPRGDELDIRIDGHAVEIGLLVELFVVKATETIIIGTQAKANATSCPIFGQGSDAIVIGLSVGENACYVNKIDLTV